MAAKKQFNDKDIQALDNIPEIDSLIERLSARREEVEASIKDTVLGDVIDLLEAKGLDRSILQELVPSASSNDGRKKRADAGQPQPPYYRDPEDHSKTAGKKGRKPAWLVGLIEEIGKDACMIENQ
jgi:DNA-binding protein H-NS